MVCCVGALHAKKVADGRRASEIVGRNDGWVGSVGCRVTPQSTGRMQPIPALRFLPSIPREPSLKLPAFFLSNPLPHQSRSCTSRRRLPPHHAPHAFAQRRYFVGFILFLLRLPAPFLWEGGVVPFNKWLTEPMRRDTSNARKPRHGDGRRTDQN